MSNAATQTVIRLKIAKTSRDGSLLSVSTRKKTGEFTESQNRGSPTPDYLPVNQLDHDSKTDITCVSVLGQDVCVCVCVQQDVIIMLRVVDL